MDLKEIGINTRNSVDSAQGSDLLESPCECGIESPGLISHGEEEEEEEEEKEEK